MELSRWSWYVWKSWFKHLADLAEQGENSDDMVFKNEKFKEICRKAKGYEKDVKDY